ncbi:MarR family transcriptional regulator [Streptomyces hydrogenans]|uniref:MarR family transcriptional regulator n=1 Tax=Streptomyces hydrogenans TaxID=1873719 RepID=UPI003829213A
MILRDPETRLRDMAETCRITERAAQAIVTDLEGAGYLTRVRNGRRNFYEVAAGTLFRHPAEGGHEVRGLLRLLVDLDSAEPAGRSAPGAASRERASGGDPRHAPATPSPRSYPALGREGRRP